MDFIKYMEKLNSLQFFIKSRSGTSVSVLAEKLDVSGRTVLRMVESLRIQGIDIKYCKKRKSYFME